MESELYHYGVKRRSGRYPYGSGDRPYQHGVVRGVKSVKPKETSSSSNVSPKLSKKSAAAIGIFRPEEVNRNNENMEKAFNRIKERLMQQDVRMGKGRDNITRGEKLARDVKSVSNDAETVYKSVKNIANAKQTEEKQRKMREKIKNMTDEDLRKSIDRMSLERRYTELERDKINSGHDYVEDVFDGIGGLVNLTGTIIGIVYMINELRKK